MLTSWSRILDAGRGAQAGFSSGRGQPTANSRSRRRVGAAAVVSGLNARTAAGAVSLGDAAQWRQLQAAGSKLLQQEGAPPRGSRRQRRRSRWRVAAAASQAAAAEQPPKPAPKFDRQVRAVVRRPRSRSSAVSAVTSAGFGLRTTHPDVPHHRVVSTLQCMAHACCSSVRQLRPVWVLVSAFPSRHGQARQHRACTMHTCRPRR